MNVVFDQLRISEDGQTLFIDIHVDTASYFTNLYLDTLTIQVGDKVSSTEREIPTHDFIYKGTFDGNKKQVSIELTKSDFDLAFLNTDSKGEPIDPEKPYADLPYEKSNLSDDLFFVFVGCKGYVSPDAPCGDDELVSIGVTFDETMYHQQVMNYTRELARSCEIPQNFIDFILLWHGFQSAIETEHFLPALEFYNKMFRSRAGGISGITKGCGCHG